MFLKLDQETKVTALCDRVGRVIVTQLKYSHIPKASQTWLAAFADDPVVRYLLKTPDYKEGRNAYRKAIEKAINFVMMAIWIRTKIAKTVHGGESLIIATYAENSQESRNRSASDRFFDFFATALFQVLQGGQTPKQRERIEEHDRKLAAVIKSTIGDKVKDMLLVNGICTSPASRGRGYGGAVLDSITDIADAQSRAVWLSSSNINNTEFYNSHGFVTVGTFALGDKNPEWNDTPVIASVMVRNSNNS